MASCHPIDSVVNRRVQNRQRPRSQRRRSLVRLDSTKGNLVPVGNNICMRREGTRERSNEQDTNSFIAGLHVVSLFRVWGILKLADSCEPRPEP